MTRTSRSSMSMMMGVAWSEGLVQVVCGVWMCTSKRGAVYNLSHDLLGLVDRLALLFPVPPVERQPLTGDLIRRVATGRYPGEQRVASELVESAAVNTTDLLLAIASGEYEEAPSKRFTEQKPTIARRSEVHLRHLTEQDYLPWPTRSSERMIRVWARTWCSWFCWVL
jgi:hypothetical protein